MPDFRGTDPALCLAGFPWHPHHGIETITATEIPTEEPPGARIGVICYNVHYRSRYGP